MRARAGLLTVCVSLPMALGWAATSGFAQHPPEGGFFKDENGMAYRAVRKTIDRPVAETRMVTRQQSTFTPRVVTETRPTTRTTFYPTTQTTVEPYVANRWNPFARPSIAYRFVPQTTWQAQTDVVNQTTTKTEYVAETKTVQVPETVHRMQRDEQVAYEPIGQVAPSQQAAAQRVAPAQSTVDPAQAALAARLRPIHSSERVVPFGGAAYGAGRYDSGRQAQSVVATLPRTTSAPRIASSSVASRGRMASDPPQRSPGQSGHRATDLTGRAQNYGQMLPRYR